MLCAASEHIYSDVSCLSTCEARVNGQLCLFAGLAPRQPLQRSYSHSGMLGYQAYALPGSMSHQRSLPANFELLETHSATVHPSAPSAPNRMQAQSHRCALARTG
jgi:hypothetical protein